MVCVTPAYVAATCTQAQKLLGDATPVGPLSLSRVSHGSASHVSVPLILVIGRLFLPIEIVTAEGTPAPRSNCAVSGTTPE